LAGPTLHPACGPGRRTGPRGGDRGPSRHRPVGELTDAGAAKKVLSGKCGVENHSVFSTRHFLSPRPKSEAPGGAASSVRRVSLPNFDNPVIFTLAPRLR